jgi:hypothetical protein
MHMTVTLVRLGHADPATTMRSYLEPIDTPVIDRAAQYLDWLAALGVAGARGDGAAKVERRRESNPHDQLGRLRLHRL